MSMLGRYARRVIESRGLEHVSNLNNLRMYIRVTPTRELLSAINVMGSKQELRTLWEAGLSSELQQAVLRRDRELTIRRR